MQPTKPAWRLWQKIVFRFTFLLLGSSTYFCWVMLAYFASGISPRLNFDPTSSFRFMTGPLFWLDRHIYHFGYNPAIHGAFPQDNHFGAVFYLSLILVAFIGAFVWTWIARSSRQYHRLWFWFRLYLRYTLAMMMFSYGIEKFIPVQMSYPGIVDLLTPLGEQTRFNILWIFMGVSPGYMMLTGLSEMIASLLLLNKRTVVLGSLIQLVILINVVSFNIFYNVSVKFLSLQLLIYALFLAAPYFYKLYLLFCAGQAVILREKSYSFPPRKQRLVTGILVLIPLLAFFVETTDALANYRQQQADVRSEKLYDVTSFVATDTLPPLLSDTLRWKRLAFAYSKYAVIYGMNDKLEYYECDADSSRRTFRLHDGADSLHWPLLHYAYPAEGQLKLSGQWKGRDIDVSLKSVPIDSMRLSREKTTWITD